MNQGEESVIASSALNAGTPTQGVLYIVATPIGNLGDITHRAIEILNNVDFIAAEDTRHSRRLMEHYIIKTPMFAFHDFNEKKKVENVIKRILNGESIALISDAGTPLISDPGYQLVSHAHQHQIKVVPVPGPSALITAMSVAGLASDRFTFEGFLANKGSARIGQLEKLKSEQRTMIFYEAPHRIIACLKDMLQVFGEDRYLVLARELTKSFETIHGDKLIAIIGWIQEDANRQRGEFVILVQGEDIQKHVITDEATRILDTLLTELPLKQASALAAKITGIKKNTLYQQALDWKEKNSAH